MISGSSSLPPGLSPFSPFLQLGMGDDRAFHGEAFDVLGFLGEKTLRNQQREIGVDVAGLLEPPIEIALDRLPDGEPSGRMTMQPLTGL